MIGSTNFNQDQVLEQAKAGDIRAFQSMFVQFQPQLKSYLYRLVANRNDMEDLAQDVFIAAFENLHSFRGEAALKTWVFTIATNKARRFLKNKKPWQENTLDDARRYAYAHPEMLQRIDSAHQYSPQGVYEIKEHIDFCFTCVSKMLPLKQQIALILVDVYGFKIAEVSQMLEIGVGAVKHQLRNARQTMIRIFDKTCALVNKNGICNQCSELNGRFNPKQDQQAELMKIQWVKDREKYDTEQLLRLRTALVKEIDPIHGMGTDLHEQFLHLNHEVNETVD